MYRVVTRGLGIALTLLLLASCSAEEPPKTNPLGKGDTAPAWTGTDLVTGEAKRFPEILNGKPAVLVFWATWCPYCKAFMPYAGQIQAEYAEHGVQVITFNAKERGQGDPKAYLETLPFPLIAIADADSIAKRYDVEFIPGLMVVNGEGVVTYRRGWTELPAGEKVAAFWAGEVRLALDAALGNPGSPSPQG